MGASFFAVSITGIAAAMCFFCCVERRQQSRLKKAAEAAIIARQVGRSKKRPSVGVRSVSAQSAASDSQPLMHPSQTVVYADGGGNPFGDQHQMR